MAQRGPGKYYHTRTKKKWVDYSVLAVARGFERFLRYFPFFMTNFRLLSVYKTVKLGGRVHFYLSKTIAH